jgi:hypothetical protein
VQGLVAPRSFGLVILGGSLPFKDQIMRPKAFSTASPKLGLVILGCSFLV